MLRHAIWAIHTIQDHEKTNVGSLLDRYILSTVYSRISISRILDKSNFRCLEQNNRSRHYQFTQNDYSISRTLDVSNKFFGPLTVRDNES